MMENSHQEMQNRGSALLNIRILKYLNCSNHNIRDTALNLTSMSGRLTQTEDILVELSILGPISKSLFLDLHMQINLPGLLFLAKKVVTEGTSRSFFLLAIFHTADP